MSEKQVCKPEDCEKISIREFGRRVGVSDTAIHKAIKAGRIGSDAIVINKKNDRPQILFEIAKHYWDLNNPDVVVLKQERVEIGKKEEKQKIVIPSNLPKVEEKSSLNELPKLDENTTYAEAIRRKAVADAEMAQLKLEREKGMTVYITEIRKGLFSFGSELRTKILAVPDRITDDMLAADNRSEAHLLLLIELTNALSALTDIETKDFTK